MRITLVCLSLAIPFVACRLDRPAPPAERGSSPQVATGPTSAGRFFGRNDRGQVRELALRKLALGVTTKQGTVRSHLTMEVAGPAGERVEAIMRLAVPRGAAVTSAILWLNGRPTSGAFVQRERARAIYQSIVDRRRDPALVSWDGPGWVSVSLFPLEHGEPRRFELEWIEPAATEAGAVRYHLPTIVEAGRVVGRPALEVDGRSLPLPAGDVVTLPDSPAGAARIVADRAPGSPFHHLLVRASPGERPPHVVMMAETSAAMTATDRLCQRAALERVLGALPATSKVTLLAADWNVSVVADEVDVAGARQALDKLDAVTSAGALHLERALAGAATRARPGGASAVLFVGRGVDGFPGDAIHGALESLRDAGVPLSLVATDEVPSPLADAASLTGGQALPAAELDGQLGALVGALRARPPLPALLARGLDWRPLETVTGETIWVGRALELPRPQDGAGQNIVWADAADLSPLWDRARLAWSEHADHSAAGRSMTTALTPLRALLVLENEQEYARFGLGRAAIFGRDSALGMNAADVLHGLVDNQIGEAYGVGGLGLAGTGSGGGGLGEGTAGLGNLGTIGAAKGGGEVNGSGYGRGAGGRRAWAPEVVLGQATVRGSLDKEIIRRIVRRHINELKYCYQQELTRSPALGGRIMVQFTIAASGQVIASVLQYSTIGDTRLEGCAVQAVRRWEFPQTLGGGIAVVSFPFVFTHGRERAAIAPPAAEQAVDPDLSTGKALLALSEKGDLATRVEHVAALLGLDRTSDPESLAWMIDRRQTNGREMLLVARLLVAAHRNHDAIRVLSEWAAAAMPAASAEELRRMGAGADAAEVLSLARRGMSNAPASVPR